MGKKRLLYTGRHFRNRKCRKKTYGASLISAYIEAFETKTDAQSQKALDYGLEALLAARRNG